MAITSEFMEAVNNGNRTRVRIMLKDIMLVDPTMAKFDEMLKYAASKMSNLYDEHDDETLKYDRTEWNEAYLNNQMVVVVGNFSKERVELLRNMVRFLYRDKAEKIKTQADSEQSYQITRKQVGTGVTAVGAVAAVAGICVQSGALIAGGVVVAAVDVGMIVTDKG